MAITSTNSPLSIDSDYLLNVLQPALQQMLNDVTNQVNGLGQVSDFGLNVWVPAVNQSLNITAPGGTAGSGSTFQVGQDLNAKLSTMGGSVAEEVTWLQTVLTDMISELQTTAQSMQSTESLNGESVQTLMTDFQQTISDINGGPSSKSSGS